MKHLGVMKYAVDNFMEKRGRNGGVGWDWKVGTSFRNEPESGGAMSSIKMLFGFKTIRIRIRILLSNRGPTRGKVITVIHKQ
jgi:hypothetical protein